MRKHWTRMNQRRWHNNNDGTTTIDQWWHNDVTTMAQRRWTNGWTITMEQQRWNNNDGTTTIDQRWELFTYPASCATLISLCNFRFKQENKILRWLGLKPSMTWGMPRKFDCTAMIMYSLSTKSEYAISSTLKSTWVPSSYPLIQILRCSAFFLLKHMSIMLDTSTSPTGSADNVVKGIKLRSKLEKYSFASVRSDVPNPTKEDK